MIPLSVLDLAAVPDGQTTAQALAATERYARHAEMLGCHRFWVAEHHNAATVASTNPPVLMAHLAAKTSRIRVGSGGVMLPNHAPLVVAEQFALLEALHPGRIDLGIGRAPGTDQSTVAALRRHPLGVQDFPRDLIDVMGLLGDPRDDDGLWRNVRATPQLDGSPEVILLGSSDYSARLAGQLGLRFAFAHHFDMGGTLEAAGLYRQAFRPSASLEEPYLIVTATAIAAENTERARELGSSWMLQRFGLRTGRLLPLLPPSDVRAHPLWPTASELRSGALEGTAAEVTEGLDELARQTEADELMLSTPTFALADRERSLSGIAQHWRHDAAQPVAGQRLG